MPSIYIECPACNWEGKADEKFVGRKVKCAKCGHSFKVEVGGTYDLEPIPAPPEPDEPEEPVASPRAKGAKKAVKSPPKAAKKPDPKLEKMMDDWADE